MPGLPCFAGVARRKRDGCEARYQKKEQRRREGDKTVLDLE